MKKSVLFLVSSTLLAFALPVEATVIDADDFAVGTDVSAQGLGVTLDFMTGFLNPNLAPAIVVQAGPSGRHAFGGYTGENTIHVGLSLSEVLAGARYPAGAVLVTYDQPYSELEFGGYYSNWEGLADGGGVYLYGPSGEFLSRIQFPWTCCAKEVSMTVTAAGTPYKYAIVGGFSSGSAYIDRIGYSVPEPGTLGLFATGLAVLGFVRRRRTN